MTDYSNDISNAIEVLRKGGLILYPTDTVWGIGCDATNADAVKRVFELKQRSDSKSLIILVGSIDDLYRYVEDVPEVAEQLIEATNRPTTIVYDHGRGVAPNAISDDGSIAIRVTDEAFSSQLCRRFRRPLISTSANVSGAPTPQTFSQISDEIKSGVDYVCTSRRNEGKPAKSSLIIKISDGGVFKILRK